MEDYHQSFNIVLPIIPLATFERQPSSKSLALFLSFLKLQSISYIIPALDITDSSTAFDSSSCLPHPLDSTKVRLKLHAGICPRTGNECLATFAHNAANKYNCRRLRQRLRVRPVHTH